MSGPMHASEHRFARFVCKMLVTFFAVVAIDLVAVSLLTQRLRVWFPVWLDAEWATRPDPWVVYSQSYFAGIFFIPLLAYAVDRDLVRGRLGSGARTGFWLAALAALGLIGAWKGELMIRFGKHWEALCWLALTMLMWAAVSAAERLPAWLEGMTARRMARMLALGVATFFLVMAVLDPALQLGVQGLAPSGGLLVEVGFFVPAGVVLLLVARRLRSEPGAGASSATSTPARRGSAAARAAE